MNAEQLRRRGERQRAARCACERSPNGPQVGAFAAHRCAHIRCGQCADAATQTESTPLSSVSNVSSYACECCVKRSAKTYVREHRWPERRARNAPAPSPLLHSTPHCLRPPMSICAILRGSADVLAESTHTNTWTAAGSCSRACVRRGQVEKWAQVGQRARQLRTRVRWAALGVKAPTLASSPGQVATLHWIPTRPLPSPIRCTRRLRFEMLSESTEHYPNFNYFLNYSKRVKPNAIHALGNTYYWHTPCEARGVTRIWSEHSDVRGTKY